jgi:hypothetical protein
MEARTRPYSLVYCSSHRRRSFYFIYGRRVEVRPQFRMRLWLDNYTLATAEKGRPFYIEYEPRSLDSIT